MNLAQFIFTAVLLYCRLEIVYPCTLPFLIMIMGLEWVRLVGTSADHSLLKAFRADCSRLCPGGFWILPQVETTVCLYSVLWCLTTGHCWVESVSFFLFSPSKVFVQFKLCENLQADQSQLGQPFLVSSALAPSWPCSLNDIVLEKQDFHLNLYLYYHVAQKSFPCRLKSCSHAILESV